MDLVQGWCLGALPQAMDGPGELRLGPGQAPAKPPAGQSGGRRGTMEKRDGVRGLPVLFLFSLLNFNQSHINHLSVARHRARLLQPLTIVPR